MPPRILLGSTNPAKIERLRDCLEGRSFDFITVNELPPHEPPEEIGGTHIEIAEAKAVAWAQISGGLAIASDGGIDIPALGPNWDSLLTRRAAGLEATDEGHIEHLLALMAHLETDGERAVTRHEAIAIAAPGRLISSWETEGLKAVLRREPVEARIEGFWLAPLLQIPQYDKPYTDLTPDELREIGAPWATLAEDIQTWLTDGGYETLRDLSF